MSAFMRGAFGLAFLIASGGLAAGCAGATGQGAATGGPTMMQVAPPRAEGTVDVWFTVLVPPGSGDVYLTGDLPEFGPWKADALRLGDTGDPGADLRVARITLPVGRTFEYKVTQGSWEREAVGGDGAPLPNRRLTVTAETRATETRVVAWKKGPTDFFADVAGAGVKGTLIHWRDVRSAHLSHPRTVSIWLPPGYDADPAKRWRVLYMSDGQNLFDPRQAFTGVDWGIDEAMVAGMEAGKFEPAIVVSTTSTPARTEEYSPWHGAPRHARFLIEELMPRVNAEFRTLTGPRNTFHMGSSMGGLLSYYLVRMHPEAFSACGCVSTHFPFAPRNMPGANPLTASNRPYVLDDIAAGATMPKGQRLFFDHGTRGLDARYGPTHAAVADWLKGQGFVEGRDFKVTAYEGSDHNEASWRAIVGHQLEWMLAPR
jgi:enterochelin esterase-like enzyme